MGAKSKLHVGFPEASIAKYGKVLVDHGFKVCVVDQVEADDSDSEENLVTTATKPDKKGQKRKSPPTFMGR